jgi:ubiquinone/menaquinone biosynthesis C-methylase UbiE
MDPRLQRRVQRYGWDKAADHYEAGWAEQLKPAQDLMLAMVHIDRGAHVLETACGTGLVSFPVAEMIGPQGRLVGTDLSDRMVEICEETAWEHGIEHASFVQMDAEDLDMPDDTFDVALCGLGLMYVPYPLVAVKEMRRVLKPGGAASVAVWGKRSNCGWADIFPIVDKRVNTDVCPMFFQLGTGESLKMVFDEAGFRDVESRRISVELFYETDADAIGAAFIGGPVAMAVARFDESTRMEAFDEYLGSIEPFKDGDAYRIPGEFVVVSGVK